jgi:hypothetical protein
VTNTANGLTSANGAAGPSAELKSAAHTSLCDLALSFSCRHGLGSRTHSITYPY